MIRVMLVDDNRMALAYFSHLVDWESLGYELVCTAIDGESAMVQFGRFHPQVIITDVQMPNMDGIDLARAVMEIAPDTMILFLSSYEEFSYIRSAMQLGVSDYILKHETKEMQMRQKLLEMKEALLKRKRELRLIPEGSLKKLLDICGNREESCREGNWKQSSSEGNRNREESFGEGKEEEYLQFFPGHYDLSATVQAHIYPLLQEKLGITTTEAETDRIKECLYADSLVIAVLRTQSYT